MAKRIFALFLCLALSSVLCLQVITGVAAADPVANGTCGAGLTWALDADGVLIVSGSGAMTDYSSSNAAPWGTEIKSAVIGIGVTSIGDSAFRDCKKLTSVTLPEGVKRIGINAFYGCTGLTEVSLPETVEGIGDSAFSDCTALTSVVLPPAVTTIAAYTFSNCSALTSVTLPTDLTSIELFAFERCTALEKITLPQSLTAIGDVAFSGCSALKEITIPENVERISSHAFTGCSSLTAFHVAAGNRFYSDDENGVLYNKEKSELIRCPEAFAGAYVIPDSVVTLQPNAFADCVRLTGITIPEGVVNFEGACFKNCIALKSVTIPGSVKKAGSWTFAGCTALAEVTLCEGISEIGGAMFQDCTALSWISIPESVKWIGNQAFSGCTALMNVMIPKNVTSIGEYAFERCTGLKSATLSGGVSFIGAFAFGNCSSLQAVCFLGSAPEIGMQAFKIYDTNPDEAVNIPGLTLYYIDGKSGWTAPEWNGYPTATWDGAHFPHTHEYRPVVTAPTCTEKGYTTYICTLCNDSYVADEVAALGHAWDAGKVTTAPTIEATGVKTFTCTRCGTTRADTIEKLPVPPFTDVRPDAYYANAVSWAVVHNVTNGTSATAFSPEATCTRGQIVTFLWRAAGEPAPAGAANPFTDVKENAYYYKAVLWAVENGITSGTSKTTFSPDEGCTRGQVATFLWRYEGMPSHTVGNPFTDVKVGAYYYEAVLWAVENGITNGTSATTFAPNDTCTRGQIVTFLYRDIA